MMCEDEKVILVTEVMSTASGRRILCSLTVPEGRYSQHQQLYVFIYRNLTDTA